MFYRTVKAETVSKVKELLSAAGQRIRKAGKTPAGNTVLFGFTLLEVGTMKTAVFFLKAAGVLLHGIGAIVDRISKADGPGPLLLEDHMHIPARTLADGFRDAWKFRAEILKECRGVQGV